MKPIIQKLWVLMVVLCATISASASAYDYDFEVDGIYYNVVSLPDLTCEITRGDAVYSGDFEIPAEVKYNNKTLSIVAIGSYAFAGCSSLTSVTIPDSVTTIGENAFWRCSSLTSVTFPDSEISIGFYAFADCSSLTSVTIPGPNTYILGYAFTNCQSLTSVTILGPDSTIWFNAFECCSSLTSVTILGSETSIEGNAFAGCSSLISVNLPDSVTFIGPAAFADCSSLTSVTIPGPVTSIGDHAFAGCSSLTSVTIPDSVTSIGDHAFAGCSSLTSITIPDSVTSIGSSAFSGCKALENVKLSARLCSIETLTFADCSKLDNLMIPGSVSSITSSFDGCSNLKNLGFLYDETVLKIDRDCFRSLNIQTLFLDRNIDIEGIYYDKFEYVTDVIIGSHIKKLTLRLSEICENLECITCYSTTPPTISSFSNAQYIHMSVRVPNEALEAYQQADVWKNFWNIEGFDPSGTETISAEMQSDSQKKEIGRFDLNGRCVSDDYNGVSVIRYSDGSTKKTVGR